MSTQAQLTLSPASMTVFIDGVSLQSGSWDKTLSLLANQAAIRRRPLIFSVLDADTTVHSLHSITGTKDIDTADDAQQPTATVTLSEWSINSREGNPLINFATLDEALKHIQLVADVYRAPIIVDVLGTAPGASETHTFGPEGATTGSLTALSQTQLESNLLSTELTEHSHPVAATEPETEPDEPVDESALEESAGETSTVPNGTVEPQTVTVHSNKATDITEEAILPEETVSTPVIDKGQTEEPQYLFEDEPVHTRAPKTPFYQRITENIPAVEVPPFLESTRNKVLAGAGLFLLGFAAIGITAPLLSGADKPDTAKLTDTSVAVPVGYSSDPLWSLDIPQDAQIKATRTATAIFTTKTLSLYDTSTGQKIRDIALKSEISTLGEITIDGTPSLIWQSGNTLYAWNSSRGADQELITVELEPDTTLSSSGDALLVKTPSKTQILTGKGLKDVKVPAGQTPMSATDTTVIAASFDPAITRIDTASGKSTNIPLLPPHEGQAIQSWKHADDAMVASVWAENPDAICDSTDSSGCNEDVTFAIHNLTDGSVVQSYDVKLEDVASTAWIDGESDIYGGFGSYVFDESTGQQVTVLPDELTAEKIKGHFILSTGKEGQNLAFHSSDSGYQLTSILLAQTTDSVVLQQGEQIIAYPLAVS